MDADLLASLKEELNAGDAPIQVELSAPDGRIFRFHLLSLVPYAGEPYAVLENNDGPGQLLVTRVEADADHAPVFAVVTEDDIISAVLEKQVAEAVRKAMGALPDLDLDQAPDVPEDTAADDGEA